jgi:hypothetical protein
MADPFDRVLIDPPTEEVHAALHQAISTARRTRRFLQAGEITLADLLDAVTEEPEGVRSWESNGLDEFLRLSWWTDHQGRRHCRVQGGDRDGSIRADLGYNYADPRPPLWHVYPERVFRRWCDGAAAWLVSCGCGMTGTPAALAWMGKCCGPCHDRQEEGSPVPNVSRAGTLLFEDDAIRGLALDAEGKYLAVAHPTRVIVRNLTGGIRGDWQLEGTIQSLDLSPDGHMIAVGTRTRGAFVRSCSTGQELLESADPLRTLQDISQVVFSPDGRMLAVLGDGNRLEIWRWLGHFWEEAQNRDRVTKAVFSPDSSTLALADSEVWLEVRDGDEWRRCLTIPVTLSGNDEVSFLGFDTTGRFLVVVAGPAWDLEFAQRRKKTGWVETWNVPELGDRNPQRPFRVGSRHEIPEISALALSPDASTLAWVIHDDQHSPAEVTLWDVANGRERGRLEWDGEEMIRELTFTPDGQTLVTGSEWGTVKFWPWRLLLEG